MLFVQNTALLEHFPLMGWVDPAHLVLKTPTRTEVVRLIAFPVLTRRTPPLQDLPLRQTVPVGF